MMRTPSRPQPAAGTSLVEALVALAIMAFGMLAVVAVQSSLRLNADVARQRSEAVRIAQEAMESARAFSTIGVAGDPAAYASITDITGQAVPGGTTNTSFTLNRIVADRSGPDHKEVTIQVNWIDRAGQAQRVELTSVVGASEPGVSGLLGAAPNGIPARLPSGRSPVIPPQAVVIDGGQSAFKPPTAGGGESNVAWVFDNSTGMIVGVCNNVSTAQADLTATILSSCLNNTTAQLLSGFIRFATDPAPPATPIQPTAADAENPTSTARNLTVALTLSSTGHPGTPQCFAGAPTSVSNAMIAVAYYCLIFSNPAGLWSGISEVSLVPFADANPDPLFVLAANADDADLTHDRICRYTPATSDAQTVPNRDHPRNYSDVAGPLVNQNFLVIRAGDGARAFRCPTDGLADPATGDLVNSNTLVHQPAL